MCEKTKTKIISVAIIVIALCSGCKKEIKNEPLNRTVIVYMAADNDLYSNAVANIVDMEYGLPSEADGKLIAFVDPPNSDPYILEIVSDTTNQIVSNKVKTYNKTNSASAQSAAMVINDIIAEYPARSYGLILWSHGTGWMPQNSYGLFSRTEKYRDIQALVKSFGRDGENEMEIADLARVLPVKFDFIIFDACLMGCVEVAYELREKTEYLISSPAEILRDGFPYRDITRYFFTPEADLMSICEKYMDYYNVQSGAAKSATISLVKSDRLDALALTVKTLIDRNIGNINNLDYNKIQIYDCLKDNVFFDLKDFVAQLCPGENLNEFHNCMSSAVLYKNHTDRFLNIYDIADCCGLSSYIPLPSKALYEGYKTTAWYKAVYP